MAALLQQARDILIPFGTSSSLAVAMADSSSAAASGRRSQERPRSPPQPVPRPRPGAQPAHPQPSGDWEDALGVSASPASSDATEQFLDCYSEPVSTASSYEADSAAAEELLSKGLPGRMSVPDTLAAAAAAVAASTAGQQLAAERSKRAAAEAAAADLRAQLDDIAALLWSFRAAGAAAGDAPQQQQQQQQPGDVAAEVRATLQAAAVRCQAAAADAAAQRRRANAACEAAAAEAADAALVARLVAGICARAATAADLEERWAAERALLQRRLDQAARMGQAMLKHQKEHSAEPEPWRQQLLNTAVSVGCSILGAATAVLIIRRTQA